MINYGCNSLKRRKKMDSFARSYLLVFSLLICSLMCMLGFYSILEGLVQFFVPLEAKYDSSHKWHRLALFAYPRSFSWGSVWAPSNLPERAPWSNVIVGLMILAFFGWLSWLILMVLKQHPTAFIIGCIIAPTICCLFFYLNVTFSTSKEH